MQDLNRKPAAIAGRTSRPLFTARGRIAALAILLGVCLLPAAPAGLAAGSCRMSQISAVGTATSQATARRNASISLTAKLGRRFPGNAKAHMKGVVRYNCQHPLLWRCTAVVKICI